MLHRCCTDAAQLLHNCCTAAADIYIHTHHEWLHQIYFSASLVVHSMCIKCLPNLFDSFLQPSFCFMGGLNEVPQNEAGTGKALFIVVAHRVCIYNSANVRGPILCLYTSILCTCIPFDLSIICIVKMRCTLESLLYGSSEINYSACIWVCSFTQTMCQCLLSIVVKSVFMHVHSSLVSS